MSIISVLNPKGALECGCWAAFVESFLVTKCCDD